MLNSVAICIILFNSTARLLFVFEFFAFEHGITQTVLRTVQSNTQNIFIYINLYCNPVWLVANSVPFVFFLLNYFFRSRTRIRIFVGVLLVCTFDGGATSKRTARVFQPHDCGRRVEVSCDWH